MLRTFTPRRAKWIGMDVVSVCDDHSHRLWCLCCRKTIGRTPFFPKISPSKTLEGALGGLIFGVIGSLLSVHFLEIKTVTLIESSVTGLILSSCAQIGDLYESLLKRKSGVKDSGRLLPGHGGALDRLDSIVFSLCVLYYFTQWIST